MKLISLILLPILLFSCNQQEKVREADTTPIIDIENHQFYSPYCIYQFDKKDSISTSTIKQIVSDLLPNYKLVDSLSSEVGSNEYTIVHFSNPTEDYPAPNIDYLQHSGHQLSEEEMNGLQNPDKASLITFSGTKEKVKQDHIKINLIIDSLIYILVGIKIQLRSLHMVQSIS